MDMTFSKTETLIKSNVTYEKVRKVISEMNERFELGNPRSVFCIPAADVTEKCKAYH
jgi:hypothetical protein